MSSFSKTSAKYSDVNTAANWTVDHHADDEHGTRPVSTLALEVEGISWSKGERQEPAFRDKWFGIIFLAQFSVIIAVAACYMTGTFETLPPERRMLSFRTMRKTTEEYVPPEDDELANNVYGNQENETDTISIRDGERLMSTLFLSLLLAPAVSMIALGVMARNAVLLIQWSLYFSIGFNFILAVLVCLKDPIGAIFPALFAAFLFCYAKAVWHRIPFAAANLRAAITCVQANQGMVFVATGNIPLVTIWLCLWTYVFNCILNSPWMKNQEIEIAVTDDFGGISKTHEEETVSAEGVLAIMGLLLSLYWTWYVMRNVVHTTLAGTVGTWWFLPHEASSCCSRGLTDSLCRSLTYSFGSICFGSLIVAIIEVLKSMLRSTARNNRAGILRLIAQCLLSYIERIAEYFNKWAFIYVGLYGYSYIEAGKNVFTLFKNRGWSTIISDALVNRMLLMMCFCIGIINGIIAAILTLGADSSIIITSALFAMIMGIILSSLVFGVVVSAVDTIIVLFAEAPAEFKENHPELAQEMEDTWSQAWPDIFTPAMPAVATPIV